MSKRDDGSDSLTETATATHLPEDPIAASGPEGPMALVTVPLDHYAIGHEHARGGLGKIVVAEDRRLGRTVAIKELIHVEASSSRRLIREARLTAKLQHPAIVPVHEAGRWPTGEPFYTMKMVSGRSLKDAMSERKTLKERLRLLPNMIAVAEAIAYAHSRRVIHRDLKPSNVLVGEFGETVVIDWGLAKDLTDESPELADVGAGPYRIPEHQGLTAMGAVIGTPAYMPPEQARGEPVDERADVYSLGAMLYHLLCGSSPFSGSSQEVLTKLKVSAPPRIRDVAPEAPPELVAIVERAMQREPESRYPNAGLLAEELVRFQAGQLVRAHEYGVLDLFKRWIARHRAIAIATSSFTAIAVVGIVLFLRREQGLRRDAELASHRSAADRDRAVAERARADQQTLALLEDRGRDELAKGHPSRAAVYFSAALTQKPSSLAYRMLTTEATRAMSTVWWQSPVGEKYVRTVTLDHREESLLVTTGERKVILVDARNGFAIKSFHVNAVVDCSGFTPDDSKIMLGMQDGTVEILDRNTGSVLSSIGFGVPRGQKCLLAMGGRSVIIYREEGLSVWDLRSGKRMMFIPRVGDVSGNGIMLLSPNGKTVAASLDERTIQLLDVRTGRTSVRLQGHTAPISNANFNADGSRLITSAPDGTVRIWDTRTGTVLRTLLESNVQSVELSDDGKRAIVAQFVNVARVYDLEDGSSIELQHGTGAQIYIARFFAGGNAFLTVTTAGEVRVFDAAGDVLLAIDLTMNLQRGGTLEMASHGDAVFIGGADGRVFCLHPLLKSGPVISDRLELGVTKLAFDARQQLLVGQSTGTLSILDGHLKLQSTRKIHERSIFRIAVSETATRILTVPFYPDWTPKLWTMDLRPVADLFSVRLFSFDGAFQPFGNLVATASRDLRVRFWDAKTGAPVGEPLLDAGQVLAFSPDGSKLATADSRIRVWDVASRRKLFEFDAHPGTLVETLQFDCSGRRLLSAGWDDHAARVWDVESGSLLLDLPAHTARIMAAEFSPDGGTIATAGFDLWARLWDSKSGELLRSFPGVIHAVAYSQDGGTLVMGVGAQVVAWDITPDSRSTEELAQYVAQHSSWVLEDGRLLHRGDSALSAMSAAPSRSPQPRP